MGKGAERLFFCFMAVVSKKNISFLVLLVMATGGSIGSELCRQIVRFEPETVLLMDSCESALYSIQMELKHRVGYLKY